MSRVRSTRIFTSAFYSSLLALMWGCGRQTTQIVDDCDAVALGKTSHYVLIKVEFLDDYKNAVQNLHVRFDESKKSQRIADNEKHNTFQSGYRLESLLAVILDSCILCERNY